MLHLHGRTPAGWGTAAVACIDEILIDHAHCEKKAASTAIGLLFRYPDHPALALPLAALAKEELEHFEAVTTLVRARGGELVRLQPPPYAARLLEVVRTHEPARAIDTLLCCSLIEARSCDRMQVLHRALDQTPDVDPAIVALYRDLLACEARHHGVYVELARTLAPRDEVDARLEALAHHEAEVIATAPVMPRLHAQLGTPAS
jgi:tRNA-(ms[2]io[6]A)-hydroxylase